VSVLQNTFGGSNTRSTTGTQQGALETRANAGATSAGNTTSALGTTGGSSMNNGNAFNNSRLP
jgi:hypothetical protein